MDVGIGKYTESELEAIGKCRAIELALEHEDVKKYIGNRTILSSNYALYSGCEGMLSMFLEKNERSKKSELKQ